MSNKITIDNLPLGAFRRYAQDQESLSQEERPLTSPPTQVDAIVPTYLPESELLFHLEQTGKTWAVFFSPPYYVLRTYRVFPFRLLPSLGSEEKLEALMANIKNFPIPPNAQKAAYAWQEEQRVKQFEEAKKKILVFLGLLRTLDKVLIEINSKRRQYLRE